MVTAPQISTPIGRAVLDRTNLQQLLDTLHIRGYQVIGPTVRDNAIIYDELASLDDLPVGLRDAQAGGSYRLTERGDNALFGYALGPQSWKKYLFPSSIRLWKAQRENGGFTIHEEASEARPMAFFGVRPCELQAILIQDKVLMDGPYVDAIYARRRKNTFIVAVNCHSPAANCFCTSMNTGPRATAGYDLAITEMLDDHGHEFLIESCTEAGDDMLRAIKHRPAKDADLKRAEKSIAKAAKTITKTLETKNLKELLYVNAEHIHWEDVASRCMTCGNCTMVCPTCFCASVEDVTDLTGDSAERWRRWDTCFSMDYSYIYGGSVRASAKSRYRQWMMHKLATWIDQFGTFGCVGCGRCITWCPVGIDITQEAAAIRQKGATHQPRKRK
ncbi:MAG: 4Fe-4S dicluster domain-containing protein [Anaerolineae bacterium]|nr:4Fe-4S dicluster domain-containing protein [Anaerolineae bacterium]